MRNKAHDLSTYSFSPNEGILVDANIWLYMFPAPANPTYPHAHLYSSGFHRMLGAGAQPYLDPMVLGEYLNRYCRIEFDAGFRSAYRNFKSFRKSTDYMPVGQAATTFAAKIVSFCQVHAIPANQLDLQSALSDFQTGATDFTDSILVDVCKKEGLKLMTNDSDFTNGGIEVLTTHPRLLSACP